MTSAVLEAEGLSVHYGGVQALADVDLRVGEGQLVGLIGPNGAGKTTLIDAVTGFASASGTVRIDGVDISKAPPHRRARAGLARTWQAADLFDDLSVLENVQVAGLEPSLVGTAREIFRGSPAPTAAVDRALELLDLAEFAHFSPEEIGQGQRKLVGVARALVAEPRVLLLDEPAAGLNTDESQELGRRLRRIVDEGPSMLLIDHDMGLVLSICDFVVVLEFGRVIGSGTPAAVRADPRVIEAYLGAAGKSEMGLDA